MGTEGVPHDQDTSATGDPADEIQGSLRRMAGEVADAGGGGAVGGCERTFRRYVDRYEDEGFDGLVDKHLNQVSARRAPVGEMVRTEALYRERYDGWNVKPFYSFYRRRHAGTGSYTWVKSALQRAGLVAKVPGRGKHRRRRERSPLEGMMLHQDGSTHEWSCPGYAKVRIVGATPGPSHPPERSFDREAGAQGFEGRPTLHIRVVTGVVVYQR